jgi:dienelactone hydrolase
MVVKRSCVLALAGILGLALLWVAPLATTYVDALSLAMRAADLRGVARHVADLTTVSIVERLLHLPTEPGLRVRVYEPLESSRQTVLLVPGLHPGGIDESGLMAFARELAKTGVTVVTPEIPGLVQFRITPSLTDSIEQAAVWLATRSGLSPRGQIGLIGASFSGGLAIVAAGRPALRGHLLYVASIGGHHDLPRILYYFCTGHEYSWASAGDADEGASIEADLGLTPHDYGLAILLLGMADRLVPQGQVVTFKRLVRRYLWASYVDRHHRSRATREFAGIRAEIGALAEPSASLIASLLRRDVVDLGSSLLPHLSDYGSDASLSPSRSPKPSVPVFLLHGRDDNVVPASESQYLTDDLRGHTTVRLLLTDLVSHTDINPSPRTAEVVRLIAFWADLLSR